VLPGAGPLSPLRRRNLDARIRRRIPRAAVRWSLLARRIHCN